MVRFKMGAVAVAVLVAVLCVCWVPSASANSAANIGGQVTTKNVYYGPQGSVSVIELTIDTMDGITWTAVCRRSNSTLGWCSPANMGNQVQVEGTITYCSSIEVTYLGIKF